MAVTTRGIIRCTSSTKSRLGLLHTGRRGSTNMSGCHWQARCWHTHEVPYRVIDGRG